MDRPADLRPFYQMALLDLAAIPSPDLNGGCVV